MKRIILLIITFFINVVLFSVTLNIPTQYPTIQAGINAAQNGDMVLVEPGTYYENINFRGKNITVTSQYINDSNPNTILNTIINGSASTEPDTGSVVLIISGEDSTAVLNGFTITGGSGTKWHYEHGGSVLRAGGGIFITLSSPTISNNIIVYNEAITVNSNILTAGGGGIRAGDGTPLIINNIIAHNKGMYCGGLDLNYTGAIIKNNIIANNKVYQAVPSTITYGGGGLCAYKNYQGHPVILENNTIVGNEATGAFSSAAGKGGGVMCWETVIIIRNNIIQGNCQTFGGDIHNISSNLELTYSALSQVNNGIGNITDYAYFLEGMLTLYPMSPCIDAGNPDIIFNDIENPFLPGNALHPSLNTLRNDIGAYGGPLAKTMPLFELNSWFCPEITTLTNVQFHSDKIFSIPITNQSNRSWQIISVSSSNPQLYTSSIIQETPFLPMQKNSIEFILLPSSTGIQTDTLYFYHNNPDVPSPFQAKVTYTVTVGNEDAVESNKPLLEGLNIYPNPFNPKTKISYLLNKGSQVNVTIYNSKGQKIETLQNGFQSKGNYSLVWDGNKVNNSPLSSGIYFCKITTDNITSIRKISLIK